MVARRLLSALLIALLISGAFTFLLARKLLKPHGAALSLRYVAAKKDVDTGEILKAEDLVWVQWPKDAAVTGAVQTTGEAIGRAVLSPLASGQPILVRQLSAVGGVGLSAKIPDGMRAISLKSDQVVGVAGFLLPGTHTDVLVTYRNPLSTDAVTATVLQNAEVIAAGQKTQPDPDGKPSTVDVVTLLVSPQDAERVVLASTQGSVHFVLRNGADQQQTVSQPMDVATLGLVSRPEPAAAIKPAVLSVRARSKRMSAKPSGKAAAKPAPADPQRYSVVMVRGDKQTVETF